MREYNHLENRERPNPEDLTQQQIKQAVGQAFKKGNCPECGTEIIQKDMAGRNITRECDKCGTEITT